MTVDYEDVPGLRATREGAVLRLTLDRERARNAVDDVMLGALIGHLQRAGLDEDVRVILLDGSGPHFCSGADLIARNAPGDRRPRVGTITRRLPAKASLLVHLLTETQTPVVAAVRGWAAGLGFHLALAADFCVAADDARFWEPFVARGFTPDSGASWLLPRLVGLVSARRLLLLGEELTGAAAAEWGLIHEAVPGDDLEAVVDKLVDGLAHGPTVALGLTKWLLHSGGGLDLDRHLVHEGMALELSTRSQDFREGLTAFREKRDARFEGR